MYLDKIITIIRDDNESDRLQMQVGLELLQTDLLSRSGASRSGKITKNVYTLAQTDFQTDF